MISQPLFWRVQQRSLSSLQFEGRCYISTHNAQYEESIRTAQDVLSAQLEQAKARAIVLYYSSRMEVVCCDPVGSSFFPLRPLLGYNRHAGKEMTVWLSLCCRRSSVSRMYCP